MAADNEAAIGRVVHGQNPGSMSILREMENKLPQKSLQHQRSLSDGATGVADEGWAF